MLLQVVLIYMRHILRRGSGAQLHDDKTLLRYPPHHALRTPSISVKFIRTQPYYIKATL